MSPDPAPLLAYGPDFLREHDLKLARRDPRHRAKRLEERIKAWWWKVSRWGVEQRKAKKLSEAERVKRRG